MNDRIIHEIEHGRKISKNAEHIWGWTSPAGKIRAKRRGDYLYKLGCFNSGDKLLEIGCGTGLFTAMTYNATGADIIALDISKELIEIARNKMSEAKFIVADAMNLEFENGSFDGVYGSSVLHHLDMDKALNEYYRVLKNGGRMVFAEPNMLNPQIFLQRKIPYLRKMMGESPDETAIIRWKIKKQLKRIGYKNIKVFPYDFLHPAVPVKWIKKVNALGKFIEKIPILKEIAGSVIIYAEK